MIKIFIQKAKFENLIKKKIIIYKQKPKFEN